MADECQVGSCRKPSAGVCGAVVDKDGVSVEFHVCADHARAIYHGVFPLDDDGCTMIRDPKIVIAGPVH